MTFIVIPGGRYVPGCTRSATARISPSWRNCCRRPHRVLLRSPFLCARFPVLDGQAASLIDLEGLAGRPGFFDPDLDFDDEEVLQAAMDAVPIYLTLAEVRALLARTGFRLMSEAEAEYAIRGRTTSLFWFGEANGRVLGDPNPGANTLNRYQFVT